MLTRDDKGTDSLEDVAVNRICQECMQWRQKD